MWEIVNILLLRLLKLSMQVTYFFEMDALFLVKFKIGRVQTLQFFF
jgi:hypothetical protein